MIFEMFPFIFLITSQAFFIKLFNNNELEIFKYSGLKIQNFTNIRYSFYNNRHFGYHVVL